MFHGDELAPVLVAAQLVALARQLECAFHRVAATVAEHHRGHAIGAHQLDQRTRQLDGARVRGAAKGVEERQLVQLRHHRVAHRPAALARVAAPQARHAVEQLVTVDVPDMAAIASRNDVGLPALGLHGLGVGHRVPQVLGVVALEVAVVHVYVAFSRGRLGHGFDGCTGSMPSRPIAMPKVSNDASPAVGPKRSMRIRPLAADSSAIAVSMPGRGRRRGERSHGVCSSLLGVSGAAGAQDPAMRAPARRSGRWRLNRAFERWHFELLAAALEARDLPGPPDRRKSPP